MKTEISLGYFRIRTETFDLGLHYVRLGALIVLLLAAECVHAGEIIGHAKVLDGDSIRIGKIEMRLHGIDAPESRQTCMREGKSWACGRSATRALADIIGSASIRCTWSERDTYERALATCFSDGANINAKMVYSGMALAYTHYTKRYAAQEKKARRESRGLWSSEFNPPWIWRRSHRSR